MKCCIMQHFILVFTVCQSTRSEVSGPQRVDGVSVLVHPFLCMLNMYDQLRHASLAKISCTGLYTLFCLCNKQWYRSDCTAAQSDQCHMLRSSFRI